MTRIEYKDYWANIEYSAHDKVLYGKIEGIEDLVTFESESAADIEKEFHSAVDDYLTFCEEVGKSPDKAYKGCFNVRIDPQLHKSLANYAIKHNESLNNCVEQAIKGFLNKKSSDISIKISPIILNQETQYPMVSKMLATYNFDNGNRLYATVNQKP